MRSALKDGLSIEREIGINPYQFGMIGSTDSHTGLSSAEEPNFWGKMAFDSIPERKQGTALTLGPTGWNMSAAGLAAVWAEDNTREAIMDAMQRREVYATTGPRIVVQFQASAESQSVPMGGVLTASTDEAPTFKVSAARDPKSANLDRIQIVKGWIDSSSKTHETIYDVAWSERPLNADGTLPAVGNTVNLATGKWENSIGAASLETTWQDPNYNANQPAFYYARVLEIPTPRHSLLDALALGLEAPTIGKSTIQERAYTSPIWVQSNGAAF